MKITEIITTIKNALETNRFSFTVSGAILFGSQANGSPTKDSDIDLLVVAENIEPKLHRRKKEMIAIKHSLPVKSLDLLLLTPAEVISNFSNHNPLFLAYLPINLNVGPLCHPQLGSGLTFFAYLR